MAYQPPPPYDEDPYRDWTIDHEEYRDSAFVGTLANRVPVFYHPDTDSMFEADLDEEQRRVVPRDEPESDLDVEERLGETLERLGDEVGWESLSEWAREHLEDEPTR